MNTAREDENNWVFEDVWII